MPKLLQTSHAAILWIAAVLAWLCAACGQQVSVGLRFVDDGADDEPVAAARGPLGAMCFKSGWCWDDPRPVGQDINHIWVFGPDDAWAAASSGSVLQWNGTTWTIHFALLPDDARDPFRSDRLRGIWGSSPRDIWVVGDAGSASHWDGETWSLRRRDEFSSAQIPAGSGSPGLYGVWGSGASDAWAVGASGSIFHYDGVAWSAFQSGTTASLNAVSGSGPDDVWAVGVDGTALRWQGAAWEVIDTGAQADLRGVRAIAPDDVWIVGADGTLLHWIGGAFERPAPPDIGTFASVVAHEGGDTWLGGGGGAHRSTGSGWDTLSPGWAVTALGGSAPDDLWMSGPIGTLAHWDGQRLDTDDSPGLNAHAVQDVWGSASDDVWVLTLDGTPGHFDGEAWKRYPVPESLLLGLRRLHGSGPDDAWAVGLGGRAAHFNGSDWSVVPTGTTENLLDVFVVARDEAWTGGDKGLVLRWDGSVWNEVPSGTTAQIMAVHGSGADDVWFTVADGSLMRWDGVRLAIVPDAPLPAGGLGLFALRSDSVWISRFDEVVHWNGREWKAYEGVTGSGPIGSIWAGADDDVWAVGYSGASTHWDGSTWSARLLPGDMHFTAVWGVDNVRWATVDFGSGGILRLER